VKWENRRTPGAPHEASFLKLDCSKIKAVLGWRPKWSIQKAVEQTVTWEKARLNKMSIIEITDMQISEFF